MDVIILMLSTNTSPREPIKNMAKIIRIGTRESQLAVWQATLVQQSLLKNNFKSELVYIKSDGDLDLQTPIYEMGIQGVFTKSLDIALLNNTIDIAVHSMKDVPVQLAKGIVQAAVLERASYKDLLVYKPSSILYDGWLLLNNDPAAFEKFFNLASCPFTIATSSIRRKAQWLNRFPGHNIENLRGNINTRLQKVADSSWHGAIFAAAGLERIQLRPSNSIELDWMLPSPAQGAIMVVGRNKDEYCLEACTPLNDYNTAVCTKIERDFLKTLLGGCSTPISALAQIIDDVVFFKGNLLSIDGKDKITIERDIPVNESIDLGKHAAEYLLKNGGDKIVVGINNAEK